MNASRHTVYTYIRVILGIYTPFQELLIEIKSPGFVKTKKNQKQECVYPACVERCDS